MNSCWECDFTSPGDGGALLITSNEGGEVSNDDDGDFQPLPLHLSQVGHCQFPIELVSLLCL